MLAFPSFNAAVRVREGCFELLACVVQRELKIVSEACRVSQHYSRPFEGVLSFRFIWVGEFPQQPQVLRLLWIWKRAATQPL